MSQVLNADSEEDISDSESILGSKADLDNVDDDDLMATLLATDVEDSRKKAKKDKQTSCTNEKKRDNLADKIFDYIYVARCRQLFSLAWYNDITYAEQKDGLTKPLPTPCCNGPSCLSPEPEFMQKKPFISSFSVKFSEID